MIAADDEADVAMTGGRDLESAGDSRRGDVYRRLGVEPVVDGSVAGAVRHLEDIAQLSCERRCTGS